MEHEQSSTPTGNGLRRLSVLLAGGSAIALVARLAVTDTDDRRSPPVIVLIMAAAAVVMLLWARRLDRQQKKRNVGLGLFFSCATTLQYQLLSRPLHDQGG